MMGKENRRPAAMGGTRTTRPVESVRPVRRWAETEGCCEQTGLGVDKRVSY